MGPAQSQLVPTISSTDKTSSGLLDGTGKQMLHLVARSTLFRNSNTCSPESASINRVDSDTLIEFVVRICQLRRQVALRRFTLRANVALEFSRSSDRSFIGFANPQSAIQQLLAGMSQMFVNSHDCQSYRTGNLLRSFSPLQGVVPRGISSSGMAVPA